MRHRWDGKITKHVRYVTCLRCGTVKETTFFGYIYSDRDAGHNDFAFQATECKNDLPKSMDDMSAMIRDDVVPFYVDLIKRASLNQVGDYDVIEMNQKIIKRWSVAALIYIKDKAWAQIG